jgi:hypothetical protein
MINARGNKLTLLDKVIFNEVISSRTAYGLIWGGTYDKKPCVIKMVMLTTGIHYDKNDRGYQNGHNVKMDSKRAEKYFLKNDSKPFYHTEFRHRRSMTPKDFFYEVFQLEYLSKVNLAPIVYEYGICDHLFEVHYGFVIMERIDCSLKDIYLHRLLDNKEEKIVNQAIDTLHRHYGIIHGDMKPSNMGAYLDQNGRVIKCCFFDCQKIKHRSQYTEHQFQKLIERDWEVYKKHIKKNREEDSLKISSL